MTKDLKNWIYFGIIVWGLFGLVNCLFKNWTELAAISTWILAGGIFFAAAQVYQARKSTDEARKSTNAQIAMELFRELRAEKAIKKMRSIYEIENNFKYLSQTKKNDVDYILDRLDTLGNLVKMKIIDEKLAIETYGGPPALRFWYKLKNYIRKKQNERGYYGENFEGFVRASLEYFNENYIIVNYYKTGEEDKPINLIIELNKAENLPRSWKEIENERKNCKA
jgi:hypothetical protein